MQDWTTGFLQAFVTLLVIMDPFGGLPVFMTLTRDYDDQRTRKSAHRAVFVSLVLMIVFLFIGQPLLHFFGISLFSFQVGGGLILLVIGVAYVLDITWGKDRDYSKDIIIPMATPLIAGPGAITALILLVNQYGYWIPLLGVLAVLFLFWLFLYNAKYIKRVIGYQGLEILSRIMGLILVALAIEMIRSAGWRGAIQ
ncbi:MAG: MarC family protein [Candidatus Neomarinimicrobiota bacterium]|nr:MAG: MarC family protein [Candidatus Neomarinimicrobiota bacterium]